MHDARIIARALVTVLQDAWNAKDATAWAVRFAEDAEFTNVFGMTAIGRPAIEENHRMIFESFFKDSHVTATEVEARLIRPDLLAARVWWEMAGARAPNGDEIPLRRSLMTLIATARAGRWSIDQVQNMDVPGKGYARPLTEIVEGWQQAKC